jgi:threonyl-tRNA synthetase
MKSLIEQYVTRRVMEYGGIEVETPIMYDAKHPSMESYFNRFPARQYSILSDNKQLFLRFAACFGQFLMAKDFNISYKHLPVKLYELTRYSFRREKSGELVGLRRLRAFTMPDCHALCRDLEQAKSEFRKRFELSISVINNLGLDIEDVEMAIRFTEEFYNQNKEFITELIGKFGKPVLVEMWKERFFYFTLKWEFNYIDAMGKASALSTDQIDVENGARYGIEFVDEDGTKKNPIILHNSPSGAVERIIYALLEKSAKISRTGGTPSLPLWLSHTQVRIAAVAKDHIPYCEKLLAELEANQIRVDIDDRDETVGKKIRESETEWIRYTVVIGDKEIGSDKLVVRDRLGGKQREMTVQELVVEIRPRTSRTYRSTCQNTCQCVHRSWFDIFSCEYAVERLGGKRAFPIVVISKTDFDHIHADKARRRRYCLEHFKHLKRIQPEWLRGTSAGNVRQVVGINIK